MKTRLILGYIGEIALSLFVLIFSIYIWKGIDLSYYSNIAKGYDALIASDISNNETSIVSNN